MVRFSGEEVLAFLEEEGEDMDMFCPGSKDELGFLEEEVEEEMEEGIQEEIEEDIVNDLEETRKQCGRNKQTNICMYIYIYIYLYILANEQIILNTIDRKEKKHHPTRHC